jgi:hypothetical protein
MRITTVGELIEVLKQYPSGLPALKADPNGTEYYEITLTERMLYQVRPIDAGDNRTVYIDALPGSGFASVAL